MTRSVSSIVVVAMLGYGSIAPADVISFNLVQNLGDGWEQEQSGPWYFTHVSEKHAYPLGINIVSYALTH